MATAAQVFVTFQDVTKALVTYLQAECANFVTQTDVINAAYLGVYASQLSSNLKSIKDKHGEALLSFIPIYKALLYDLGTASNVDIASTQSKFTDLIEKLRLWMYTNNYALLKQTMTITLGAIVGNATGLVQYCKEDKYGYEAQHAMPGDVKFKCIKDKSMGVLSGAEIFEIIPDNEGYDALSRYGKSNYGVAKTVKSLDPVLTNIIPSGFWVGTTYSTGTGVVSSISPWAFTATKGALTDLIAGTTVWRTTQVVSMKFVNPAAAPLGTNKEIEIYVPITVDLNEDQPYLGFLVYANETNGGGADVTVTIGTKSTTVTLTDAGGVAGAATRLKWKEDKDAWLANFKPVITAGPPAVYATVYAKINVILKTGMVQNAGVRIHGLFLYPSAYVGRIPQLFTGGSVDWALGDYWTWNNTYTAGTGKIVQALREQIGAELQWMLPSAASGAPGITVIADPT